MFVVICYDVATESTEGRRRLRKVAKACEAKGQRVQKSVFEFQASQQILEELERELLGIIDTQTDCLRIYRISGQAKLAVKEYGQFQATDFNGPLVL